MRGARTTRHKGLTRVDHPAKRTFGYMARVLWNGELHYKFFSDGKYGDRLGALAAALDWRDATERRIGKPRTDHPVVSRPRPSNTGIPGVRRRRDGQTDYYEATWTIAPGKLGRTKFSVAKHGEAKARRLAKSVRDKQEKLRWRTPRQQAPQPAPEPVAPQQSSDDQQWLELVAAANQRLT